MAKRCRNIGENFNLLARAHELYSLLDPESLDFATPLAFNTSVKEFLLGDLRKICLQVRGWLEGTKSRGGIAQNLHG